MWKRAELAESHIALGRPSKPQPTVYAYASPPSAGRCALLVCHITEAARAEPCDAPPTIHHPRQQPPAPCRRNFYTRIEMHRGANLRKSIGRRIPSSRQKGGEWASSGRPADPTSTKTGSKRSPARSGRSVSESTAPSSPQPLAHGSGREPTAGPGPARAPLG